jgi:RNA polymerase sigma factor (sigma-70 family)
MRYSPGGDAFLGGLTMSEGQGGRSLRNKAWLGIDESFRIPLTAYFLRRIRNRVEAEDLTQEVFLRLTRRPDQNNGENIEAYVFKIAACVLADWGRRQSSHKANAHSILPDATENCNYPAVLVEDRTPERVLLGREALRKIEESLAELSQRTRDIFLLSRLELVPNRDIAVLHGISISAVEKHVIKAIAHISRKSFETTLIK